MTKHIMPLLLVSLLASCQPSYAEVGLSRFGINSVFVEELNTGLSLIKSDVRKHHIIASHYQPLNNHSFNYVDAVAVNGNNVKQELQNLFTTVQYHHTLVDVFLCLSFASCLFAGELRLALALVYLWWGGHGNKPLGANTVCRCCNGSEPPYRPTFRANNQNIITHQKGTTK